MIAQETPEAQSLAGRTTMHTVISTDRGPIGIARSELAGGRPTPAQAIGPNSSARSPQFQRSRPMLGGKEAFSFPYGASVRPGIIGSGKPRRQIPQTGN